MATIVALLTMDAYNVSIFPRGAINTDKVGTLGDWFAGLATAGAVVLAVAQLRGDRARADEERKRRDVAVASEVYSWVETRRLHPGRMSHVLVVVNRTASPIYDWSVSVGDKPEPVAKDESAGPILPGERLVELDEEKYPVLPNSPPLKTSITFLTSLGTRFTRDSNGNLAEIKS